MEVWVFYTASAKEIKEGKITDVYFLRTLQVLRAKGIDKWVKAEFMAKTLPRDWGWGVLAGIGECIELCKGLRVTLQSMKEGTFFRPYEPVITIEGRYTDFILYETALLGLICQASGIATQAARCKGLAGDRSVISFGARRMHPALTPMIERSAYIGGCDGVAVVKSAELLDLEPSGTMPHSLVLLFGDSVKAAEAFHDVIDKKVRRVALVDTFGDEKFEALRVAQALGQDLFAVRLDTPSSRRGNLPKILEEVRWELNLRGFENVKLFVSGGIDESMISELNPYVDAYGIGTAISNAPVIDFAMDIVEIDGEPLSKRGKMGGGKEVLRCKRCHRDEVRPLPHRVKARQSGRQGQQGKKRRCPCGGVLEGLHQVVIKEGEVVVRSLHPKTIRDYVLKQLTYLNCGPVGKNV